MQKNYTLHVVALGAALLLGLASRPVVAYPQAAPTGELRTGDRIYLRVEGERQWTDTFDVHPGPQIDLPMIGVVQLAGVRRDSLQPFFMKAIGRYVKSPNVQVTALVRVGVIGEVARPGFYDIPADAMLVDAITDAGGLTRDAEIAKLHIDRAGSTLEGGKPLHAALDRGATLGQLDVEAGDEVVVPHTVDSERTIRIISVIIGIPLAVLTIILLRR